MSLKRQRIRKSDPSGKTRSAISLPPSGMICASLMRTSSRVLVTRYGCVFSRPPFVRSVTDTVTNATSRWKPSAGESSHPGELLSADTFFVGRFKGIGKLYLRAVADTYSSYDFGFLPPSQQPEAAVSVLHNDVLPLYAERNLTAQAILTDNGREFCGTTNHAYELYLALDDIEHRRTRVRSPQTNGFVERFHRTVLNEFFVTTLHTTFYDMAEALQPDLDRWLVYYNTERPHQGHRNMGRRSIDTINLFVSV